MKKLLLTLVCVGAAASVSFAGNCGGGCSGKKDGEGKKGGTKESAAPAHVVEA